MIYLPANSILTGDIQSAGDYNEPFRFIVWLQKVSLDTTDTDLILNLYHQYIHSWNEFVNNIEPTRKQLSIEEYYLSILEDINLNFLSEDERRFLSNIDLNSEAERDLMLGFYSIKLKNICHFFCNKREQIKQKIQTKGMQSSSSILQKNAYLNVRGFLETSANIPLSALNQLEIEIEELTDIQFNYFDPNDLKYTDKDTINITNIRETVILDFAIALRELISKVPFIIKKLSSIFVVNPTVDYKNTRYKKPTSSKIISQTDPKLLPRSDFENYIKDKSSKLTIETRAEYIKQSMGNTFSKYYVPLSISNDTSTISEDTTVTPLRLDNFSFESVSNTNILNITNINYPQKEDPILMSVRQLGAFNLPCNETVSFVSLPKYDTRLKIDRIQPGQHFIYPDNKTVLKLVPLYIYDETTKKKVNIEPVTRRLHSDASNISEIHQIEIGEKIISIAILNRVPPTVVLHHVIYSHPVMPVYYVPIYTQFENFLFSPSNYFVKYEREDTRFSGYNFRQTKSYNAILDPQNHNANGIINKTTVDIYGNKFILYKFLVDSVYIPSKVS